MSLPQLCIWSGCFPLLWAPGHWCLWGSQLSLSCPSSRPCSPQSSCSGRWWSGKPLWTAGGWRSSGLWQSLLADPCYHKWTRNKHSWIRQSSPDEKTNKRLSQPRVQLLPWPSLSLFLSALIKIYYYSLVFHCWCRLQTTQVCSWTSSTTLCVECWMGWQQCRSPQSPCCTALWWHPLHYLGSDPPRTRLHKDHRDQDVLEHGTVKHVAGYLFCSCEYGLIHVHRCVTAVQSLPVYCHRHSPLFFIG